jgi:hypothetical protein
MGNLRRAGWAAFVLVLDAHDSADAADLGIKSVASGGGLAGCVNAM